MTPPLATTAISTAAGAMLASPAGLEAFFLVNNGWSDEETTKIVGELEAPFANLMDSLEVRFVPIWEPRRNFRAAQKEKNPLERGKLLTEVASSLKKFSNQADRYQAAADEVVMENNYVVPLSWGVEKRRELFGEMQMRERMLRIPEWRRELGQKLSLVNDHLAAWLISVVAAGEALFSFSELENGRWVGFLWGGLCLLEIFRILHLQKSLEWGRRFFEKAPSYFAEGTISALISYATFATNANSSQAESLAIMGISLGILAYALGISKIKTSSR